MQIKSKLVYIILLVESAGKHVLTAHQYLVTKKMIRVPSVTLSLYKAAALELYFSIIDQFGLKSF
jgi:hypothetical protein